MEASRVPRKACDFCYLRKMKCDGQKPRCSHCTTYEVECTFSVPSRQYKPRNRKASAKVDESTINLQARVQHLEALLGQLRESSQNQEQEDDVQTERQNPFVNLPARNDSTGHGNISSISLELPSQQQVLPLIHLFIEKFNAVLPLFSAESLLRLVYDTYNVSPIHRNPVAWAAVNVVLGLAHRKGLIGITSTREAVGYLNRAQSVLSDIVLGDIQLLNIQVLVGMVMLLEGSEDLQPALILIATTIRLAHKIGLHNHASSGHLDPVLAKQRAYVFWIAYILDKNLSLRSKQPSIQLDDDIDLGLPDFEFNDFRIDGAAEIDEASVSAGIIITSDGTAKIDYFTTRIQLAVIEGGVYDYMFSTRSQKRSAEERSCALESVSRALQQWKATIPPEFHGAQASMKAPPDTLWFLCVLQGTSLMCTTCINQAHFMNTQWVSSLRKYGSDGTVPRLPPQWEGLVVEARDLMVLFGHSTVMDCWNWWITGCSYMTAMILLTAYSMHKLEHENSSLDKQLVDTGLQTLDRMVKETNSTILRSTLATCVELHQRAQQMRGEAIMMAKEQHMSHISRTRSRENRKVAWPWL